MTNYKIEQISRKTEVSPRTKREYEKIGLKINGEWCNGFGRKGVTDNWDSGMEITGIRIMDKEYEGKIYKNWELISPEERITALEVEMEKFKSLLLTPKIKVADNKEEETDPIEDLPF